MSGEPPTQEPGAPAPAEEKRKTSPLIFLLPLGFLVVLIGFAFSQLTSSAPAPAGFASPVRPAPQFDVQSLDGRQVKLADFKGRPVLVNFWGSYCAPCKLEHPLLMQMAQQGVEIVGMLYEDPALDAARDLLAKEGNPFATVGIDPHGDLGIAMGISGVPESFLIDANGQIVKTQRNYFTARDVPEFVAAYRAEQAKAGKPASPG